MDARIEAFKGLSVAAVSDAIDRLGLHGACLGISPLAAGNRMAGRAFTLKYIPVGVVKGTVGDYIDDVPPGDVVVLDNAGRLDCTVWGDILTSIAHKRGIAGTVINGVCRDVARSFDLHYPIFSRAKYILPLLHLFPNPCSAWPPSLRENPIQSQLVWFPQRYP